MAGKTTLLGGLVLTVFNLLMSGGLVSAILNEKPVTLRKFWSECGYYFGRMVRLLILTAIVFLVLIFLIFWLWSVLKGLLPRYASEYVPLSVFCLWILISAGVGLIGFLFIDIIRIRIVQLDAQSIFRNSLWALNLLLKNPVRLLSMYLMIHILWVSLLVLYGWFQSFVSDGTYSGLLVNFLGLQLGVILQYGVRFSKFGALQQILLSVDTMQEQERKILGE
ncbi:MAG: hypothetical protein Kow0042_26780 [Calditrichia bacterium]